MKKVLLSVATAAVTVSILACSANAEEMLFPDFKSLNTCGVEQIEYKVISKDKNASNNKIGVFKNRLSSDVKVVRSFFEQASSSLEDKNINKAVFLTSNGYKYKIKSNIVALKGNYMNEDCSAVINGIEQDYKKYVKALEKMIEEDSLVVEESSSEEIQEVKYLQSVETKNVKAYNYSYMNNELYIVATKRGVNVRNDPMLQTKAKVIDTLHKDTVLRQIKQVRISKNEIWGKFSYLKNEKRYSGWIRMDHIHKIQYSR